MKLVGMAGPTPDETEAPSAWQWLLRNARGFLELGPELRDLEHRAAVAAADLRAVGDMEQHELALETVRRVGELARRQEELADDIRPVVDFLGGLGALPWLQVGLTAGAVVTLAGGVAWVLSRTNAERAIVRLLERRALTAQEAERLLAETEGGGWTNPLGSVTTLATLGILGFVLWSSRK